MAYRGWFELDGLELVNSRRVVDHLNPSTPTTDDVFTAATGVCSGCGPAIMYDDSWPGLDDFLGGTVGAPWHEDAEPASDEFVGIWPLKVTGLDSTPVSRNITELEGAGGSAAPHRDTSRKITVNALLLGCSNAGVQYGLGWLGAALRRAADLRGVTLRYLGAHPGGTAADPADLVRELHNVVYSGSLDVQEYSAMGMRGQNRQAAALTVQWEMTALSPYAYLPPVTEQIVWDSTTTVPIQWVHAADCTQAAVLGDMPVLFSTECVPATLPRAQVTPPVCGGCLPVGNITAYTYQLPAWESSRDAAVTLTVTNNGGTPVNLQAFWQLCDSNEPGAAEAYPLQISGLPAGAALVLDGVSGRYWATVSGRRHKAVGIVGTPSGQPWRPLLITPPGACYSLVVRAAPTARFTVELTTREREA